MRIIHVIDDLNEQAGGPAQACIEMAAAVAGKGHHVSIYARGRRPSWFPQSGTMPIVVRHMSVDVHFFPAMPHATFRHFFEFRAALESAIAGADVVHAHVLYGFHLWAAWQACQRHNVPLIVRPCGILNGYMSSGRRLRSRLMELLFQNRLLRQAALMHYTTEQEAIDAAPYVGNPSSIVLPLGLNLSNYDNLPPRTEFDELYPQARGRKIVLYFGRLHRKKRLDLVVQAAAAAVLSGHDVHLIVAGADDGMEAECRRMVQQEGLAARATFTGVLVGHAKRVVFGGADIFILPSMTENFGISVAEAAAAGVPLLISDQVNIASVFGKEQAAVIVPARPRPVIEGLEALLSHSQRAKEMAIRAKDIVGRRFSWEVVADELVQVYLSPNVMH